MIPATIDDLTADPSNPRKITRKAARALGKSIGVFGDISGIVFNVRTGQLVAGHQRVAELKARGGTLSVIGPTIDPGGLDRSHAEAAIVTPDGGTFPVRLVEWDEAKQAAANLSANNPLISGEYTSGVTDIIEGLHAEHGDLVDGLRLDDLGDLYSGRHDSIPESSASASAIANVVVKRGDLWICRDHRIVCGDCTNEEDFALATNGNTPSSVVTDPPYGIGFNTDYKRFTGMHPRTKHRPVANDDRPFDPSSWMDYESVVLWGGNCFSNRLPLGTWLIWDKRHKDGAAMLSDCEIAWMKGGHGAYIFAETSQGFVRPEPVQHPTQKPISVMAWSITKSKAGKRILDPYLGSGTTVIAAEHLHRACCGIEINEGYVQIALLRWQKLTGGDAVRHDGKTLKEVIRDAA